MNRQFFKIFLAIVLALLQITLLPALAVVGVWPNLVLILALILIFWHFEPEGFLVGGLGGLMLDLAGPLSFGLHTLFILGLLFLNRFFIRRYLTELNFLSMAALAAANDVFYHFVFNLFFKNISHFSLMVVFGYAMLASGLFYLAYFKMHRLDQSVKIES